MSDHKCEIVPVVLEKHPNADTLSVVRVFDGYTVIVRTADWEGISQGVYLPPDTVVPDTEQFKFLEGHLRIKAKKLRGIESYGMLVPVPWNASGDDIIEYHIGDDLAEVMVMQHYEPELSSFLKSAMGNAGDPPPIQGSIYDMENWRKYKNEFVSGEEVVISEKIHGTNSRYTYQNGRMYCGSHRTWKKQEVDDSKKNLYWDILKSHPWVEAFCRLNPGFILYGEIFGAVQKGFNYGSTQDNPYQFRAFDVFAEGRFLDYDNALGGAKSDFLVPVLYRGPYSHDIVAKYMNGRDSISNTHIREGIVVKPTVERYSPRLHGRVILKCVSMDYLSQKGK
jgi:RNA ligase (TIGR02306 family)